MNKEWINAAIVLSKDPTTKVNCPKCNKHFLQVMDIESNVNPSDFERYLSCPGCNVQNILRMKYNNLNG